MPFTLTSGAFFGLSFIVFLGITWKKTKSALLMSLRSNGGKNCMQVRFPICANHFWCYCFFFSSESFEKKKLWIWPTIHLSLEIPQLKVLMHSWLLFLWELFHQSATCSFAFVSFKPLKSAFSKFSFWLLLTFFLFLLIKPVWKTLLLFSLFSSNKHFGQFG